MYCILWGKRVLTVQLWSTLFVFKLHIDKFRICRKDNTIEEIIKCESRLTNSQGIC